MKDNNRETISYYCNFNKLDNYKESEEVPPDKVIIREIDGLGHFEEIKGVRKLNILA